MTDKLCIYHGGCDDGFGAALAVHDFYGDEMEFYPGAYGKPPPDCTDKYVTIVDFSYKRHEMLKIANQALDVLVLDHHKTAQQDLEPLLKNNTIRGVFDMTKSGARLAWEWFHPGHAVPALIEYIEDRDLWKFKMPGSYEHSMALRSYPQEFDVWRRLRSDQLIVEGCHIVRWYNKKLDEVERTKRETMIAGYKVLVANAPWFMASDLAGKLAEGRPFGAVYWDTSDGRTYSLRSRGEQGIDVAKIAEQFGGGGHRNAAGF